MEHAGRQGRWAIALHGGAGVISRDTDRVPYEQALEAALSCSEAVLERGRHGAEWALHALPEPPLALAAALAAVESMEDCPLFNAGRGAVFNDAGVIENEASVMYGETLRTGAVCGLRTVQNPARLATVVHAVSRFQFLGFKSAEAYADKFGTLIARQEAEWFETERRRGQLERARARGSGAVLDHSGGTITRTSDDGPKGTVGCAVCDDAGNVAVVTSTGGQTNKMAGRIGDTPMIGAGSYADNRTLALSGTGNGEEFIKLSGGARVSCAMQYGGMSASDALHRVVHGSDNENGLPEGSGGFVAVTPDGAALACFNSTGMFRALADSTGKRLVRIWED